MLKPLLIKCYCEIAAKVTFITLALLIRYGPSREAYPFIRDVGHEGFAMAMCFTISELVLWAGIQYGVETYLRRQRCQYMLQ